MGDLKSRPFLYKLRQATTEDCRLLFRLQKLDGAQFNQGDTEQIVKFKEYESAFNPDEIQVICIDDEPVGRLRVVRSDDLYLGGIQILPEYRGKGVGTAVLQDLINESKNTSKKIRLEVFHHNYPAIKLYEKMGFKVISENEQQKIMFYSPF